MNKLIVESKNDKIFVEKILKILNLQNIEVSEPICLIDECICLDGLGNLEKKLKDIKLDGLDKLGILIDADEVGIQTRISEINKILKKLNIDIVFENINELDDRFAIYKKIIKATDIEESFFDYLISMVYSQENFPSGAN